MTKKEKEYIKAIVDPFKSQFISLEKRYTYEQGKKWEYIRINYKEVFGDDHINFPWFEPGTKFKDLELFKNYTMETINEE